MTTEKCEKAISIVERVYKDHKYSILSFPKRMSRTPQGSQELSLLMAGLGKRQITLPENSNHAEVRIDKIMY